MQQIIDPINKLEKDTWQYLKSTAKSKSAKNIDNKRNNLIANLRVAHTNISNIKDIKNEKGLKQSSLDYLTTSLEVLEGDFEDILLKENIAESSIDHMIAYLEAKEKASDKIRMAGQKLMEAQLAFAKKHKIKLAHDNQKTVNKIKETSEAIHHYHDVFLIFYTCYKQEHRVIEAQKSEDEVALKNELELFNTFIEEGFKTLQQISPCQQDTSLINACTRLLNFYQFETNKSFASLLTYFEAKNNMLQAKANYEAIPQQERTQENVNTYNAAIIAFNQAVENYNTNNELANTEREKSINFWNEIVGEFFHAHS